MKKTKGLRRRLLTGVLALVLGLGIFGLGFDMTAFVSYAESQVKVTSPKGANIRKEASTSSAAVGGAENGKVLTVITQVQGGDGYTWYQVKSGEVTGYIRSDLVEVTEGSAPTEGGEGGEGGQGGEGTSAPTQVTAVNPISATVSSESGKIRDSASSEGQILAEVTASTVLTVTGQAVDADGREWYQVSFISGETEVQGFIRYDYVTLAGELTPLTENPSAPAENEPQEPPAPTEPEKEDYYTLIQDGEWLLVDNTGDEPDGYSITKLFDSVENNRKMYQESEKTVKSQKIIIIVMVFFLVAAAAAIAFLVFKIRDMMDSAYFREVENETMRKKSSSSDRGGQRAPRGTAPRGAAPGGAGQEKTSARPTGARTAGYGQGPEGSRQGERGNAQGQRTGGTGAGQRPAGASQGQRPGGAVQGPRPVGTGQRPAAPVQGQRPAGASQGPRPMGTGQTARPVRRPEGAAQRPAGSGQRPVQRPAGASQAPSTRPAPAAAQKSQPKNFMADDDDFDNEFLNYDE